MLKLYTGRENTDKERFIYEHISGETFVLVPNQYTLVAEEQALHYMGTACLFDVEILSMNRLGLRILTEQGLESTRMLDKYGRFMLLNRIIKSRRDELDIFSDSCGKISFTSMVNDFISQFKQQECSMEEIREMLSAETDELLRAKLTELSGIVEQYEESIKDVYTDSEDYIAMYVNAISDSSLIAGKNIWIYGYDSITPKFLNAVMELAKKAESVNFVINRTDFGLDELVLRKIYAVAAEKDVEITESAIGTEYVLDKSETVARIERSLWNDASAAADREENREFLPEDLTLVRSANPYYEAETAAVYVWHLIRDLGYRMRDIQIIANDEGAMQPIVRRTFEEYGLRVFMDQSRSITDASAVSFIVNQLWFLKYRDGTDDLLSMLKTGMAGFSREEIEQLENYVRRYRIRGTMWLREFKYGAGEYGEEFAQLEAMRKRIAESIVRLGAIAGASKVSAFTEIKAADNVEEFVRLFREYLEDEWQLSEQVEKVANEQIGRNFREEAQRDMQAYLVALDLLDQMVEIMGDEPMDLNEFIDIYTTGLANIEVGVIPPTVDGLSMGTMIRTRPRPAKAVVVLGANEGTLPLQPSTEGLFSIDEKKFFRDRGFALGTLDDIKMDEENAAMYRMLSKPSEKLYISWSMTDVDGAEAAASPLVDQLIELFPRIKTDELIRKDVISAGWSIDSVNSPRETIRHLINHLKDKNTPREMDALTQALIAWFENNDDEELQIMLKAAQDENDPHPIGKKLATGLYGSRDGSLSLSASSISSYFDCPFKYFVSKGLRPLEEREFAADSRSIGELYHECLQRIAKRMIDDGEFGRRVAECTAEELDEIVSAELDSIAGSYNEGLFISTENEEFRLDRIKEICAKAAREMAEQLATGNVRSAKFEEPFGRGGELRPIEFDADGVRVYVEGKIDRADMMVIGDEEEPDRVRIIDYKTGSDKFDAWKMSHGYKMQLMIYMMSALGEYEPAGMFYINIKDPILKFNDVDDNKVIRGHEQSILEEAGENAFKLNGAYVSEPGVLEAMPASALAGRKSLSREEFEQLKNDVSERIKEIATGIIEGKISIRPFKDNKKLVCNYCDYRSICRRDREYVRNSGREIPPQKKKKKDEE
ncbi:MAG: exodeoxyribonuclease V subunit gamma [Mogibacterium sp.]|nr:exodeoxyribonuclease V subunit gamma [Mogibacterium sp.]